MIKGIDCATPLTAATAAALYAAGYRVAARYLVPDGYAWKRMTRREAEDITAAGMQIVSVFETIADRPKGGAARGHADGAEAREQARMIGQPEGSAIYFAADWDAHTDDYDAIEAYLRAAAAQIPGYEAGVYGSYAVIEEMAKRGACRHYWQTYAWSRGKKSAQANMYQYRNGVTVAGHPVDLNEVYNGSGWWNTKGEIEVAKEMPTIYKERIIVSGGKLKYIPIATAADRAKTYTKNSGTDVRFMTFKKGSYRTELHWGKGMKVTTEAKKSGADYAINFPYFDWDSAIVVGTVWDGSKYVNGAYGKMQEWYELGFTGGAVQIGQLTDAQIRTTDNTSQGKILITGGKMVWKDDGLRCQRTFIGMNSAGDLLLAISDGRTDADWGLTVEEMALYMRDKGAVNAIEGDGGGSSILYSAAGGTYSPGDRTYKPGGINQSLNTGANERIVHHAVLVWIEDKKAPKDWKRTAVEWLHAQGMTDTVRDPDATPTWAELGAALMRQK